MSLNNKQKNIHLSKEEMNQIIKEELDSFRKEIKDRKEKDQFAYKFSKVFTEALEVPEHKSKLVEDSVYNILKEYTSGRNGGVTYSFDQQTYDKLYHGVYLVDNALNDLFERDIINKDSLDARWLEEGVLVIKEILQRVQSMRIDNVNESLNEGIFDDVTTGDIVKARENPIGSSAPPVATSQSIWSGADETPFNFTKEELKYLKFAPPKEYAQQYVKLLLSRAKIPGKIINSMQFPASTNERPKTKVLYIDTRDQSEHFCDVAWITAADDHSLSTGLQSVFNSRASASVSLPNSSTALANIKLFGKLDSEHRKYLSPHQKDENTDKIVGDRIYDPKLSDDYYKYKTKNEFPDQVKNWDKKI